jgi:superfamily II DNA or RNA helicase
LNIIANPMDLGSIATRLGRESYYVGPSATSLFAADVRLVFTNCKTFNSDESDIWHLADELLKTFEKWLYEWILCPTAWLKLPPTGSVDEDRTLAKHFRGEAEGSFDTWLPWQTGCCICHSNEESDQLLLCDRCDGEIHMFCSSPAITELPEGEWYCSFCEVRKPFEEKAKGKYEQHRQEKPTVLLDQASDASAIHAPSFLWEPIEEVKKFNRNVAGKQDLNTKPTTSDNAVKDRATFFLVKWVGMSIRYSTWERPEEIGDDEQIQRYFKASRMPTVKEISETTCQLPCCARRNQLLLNSVAQRCCEKDKFCTRGFQHEGDCSREIKSIDKAYGTPAFRHLRMVEQVKAQLFAFHCLLNNHTPDKEVLKQCGVYTNAYVCKKQYLHASLKQAHRVGDNEDEDYSEDDGSESEDDDYDDEMEEDLPYRFRRPAPVSLYTDIIQGGMEEGDDDDDDSVGKKKPEDEVSDVLGALVEHVALGYPTTLEKVVQKTTYNSKYPVTSFQGMDGFTEYCVALPKTSLGLGMRLGSNEDGASVVLGFQRLTNGMVGPAESSQVITTGDVLAAVNNVSVASRSFKEAIALIAQSPEFVLFHFHSKRLANTYPDYCQAKVVKMRREPVFDNAAEPSAFIPYSYNAFKSPMRVGTGAISTTTSHTIANANFLTPTGPMQHLYAGIVDNSIDPHEHFASFLPADRSSAKQTAKKTADKNDFVPYEQSPTFKGGRTLRSYQVDGLNWMVTNWKQQRSCILADEMGLGKTVQVVSFIDHLRSEESIRGPFLIVVPLSTIQHWRREIESWTDLNVCVYHDIGDHRGNKFTAKDMRAVIRNQEWYYPGLPNSIFKFNVLLTTFETILADFEDFEPIHWRLVVVDEAHRLKSAGSRVLKQMRVMHCDRKLLLTGTPLQNNTQELWVLLNYLEPVKFASMDDFNDKFGKLQSQEQVVELQKLLTPFLLRRVKEDVEKSIPPKEETIISVELTTLQKQYYRAIYDKNKSFLYRGAKNSLPTLNNIQLQLRKCCNHPFLIKGVEERELEELGDNPNVEAVNEKTVQCSGKMVLVSKLLPKLKREGHKVLIFSQFLKQLDLLERYCEANNFGFERLDGTTSGSVRQNAIDRFSRPNSKTCVFLLSTKAGGVGINLIAADTVIIFDSDWNPQNDLQAQARCHRIGQKKAVQIYRLVTRNTYESEMFDRASRKLGLEQAVLGTAAFNEAAEQMEKPSAEQLVELLKRGAYALMEDDDKASRQFAERDIETILKENARVRVVGPSGETGEDGALQVKHKSPQKSRKRKSLGGIAFDRSSFVADGSSDLSVDDPNFWEKVMPGAMSVEMLSAKLEDGSVLASRQSKIKFISNLDISLGELANDLRNANDGDDGASARSSLNIEHEYTIAMKVLHRITTKHKDEFSNDQVDLVKSYLTKLEKSRVRSCRITPAKKELTNFDDTPVKKKAGKPVSNGAGQVLSDEEIEISSDDDDDEDGGKKSKNGRKKKSKALSQRDMINGAKSSNPSKKRKTLSTLVVDNGAGMFPSGAINDSDDLCTLCGDGGLILLCDGPCHRSFHLECIGMDTEPDDEQWLCPDCSAGRHMCLICKQVGEMGTEFGVVQCSVAKCGRFYHRNCLTKHPRVEWVGAKRFRCPSHYCHGCPQDVQLKQAAAAAKNASKKKQAVKVDPVIGCIHCAHSLHPRCIKATDQYIRLSPSLMICANHLRPKKASKQANGDGINADAKEPAPATKKAKPETASSRSAEARKEPSSTKTKKLKARARDEEDDEEAEKASAKKKAKVTPAAPAVKICALCRRDEQTKGGTLPVEGVFIEAPVRIHNQDKTSEMVYLHLNCALHSPEVFVKPDGTFCNLARAVKRGRQLACSRCKERGATVGCVVEKCRCNYHLRCAIASKGEFIGSPYSLYCKDHAVEKREEPKSFCVCGTQDQDDNSLSLECGSCEMKFHARCVNMSERQALRKSKEKSWLCASCSGEAVKPVAPPVKAPATAATSKKSQTPERSSSSRSRSSTPASAKPERNEPTPTKKAERKKAEAKTPETKRPESTKNHDEEPVEAEKDYGDEIALADVEVEIADPDEPERETVNDYVRDRESLSPPRSVRSPGRKRSRKPVATKKMVPLSPSLDADDVDVDSDHE